METQCLRTLQKKRTTNFREDETKLLIQLWGSPQIQNKLYLTHRKEPVMRLLAANMQQRGFYRTPDEIKTRIRNLKCLYHRIKRTVQSGAGIGTVDPDWPHFKAMDNILSKQNIKKDIYKENVFEGPKCEDIKQEIDDIADEMESYTTNSLGGSDYEDEHVPLPPLTPAPNKQEDKKSESKALYSSTKNLPTILPNIAFPTQQQNGVSNKQGNMQTTLPFPLLILNGLQTQNGNMNEKNKDAARDSPRNNNDINQILRDLVDVQRENLDLERQRLEIEKQKLEFERFVGSQLLAVSPVMGLGGLFQRCASSDAQTEPPEKNGRKRKSTEIDIFKESKLLKSLLSEGIRKYMMGEEDSENEDSGIHNEDSDK